MKTLLLGYAFLLPCAAVACPNLEGTFSEGAIELKLTQNKCESITGQEKINQNGKITTGEATYLTDGIVREEKFSDPSIVAYNSWAYHGNESLIVRSINLLKGAGSSEATSNITIYSLNPEKNLQIDLYYFNQAGLLENKRTVIMTRGTP